MSRGGTKRREGVSETPKGKCVEDTFQDLIKVAPRADLEEVIEKMVADGQVEKRIVNGIAEYRLIGPNKGEPK